MGQFKDVLQFHINAHALLFSLQELNALNKGSGEFDFASVAEIRSVGKDKYDTILAKHPDISVTLGFDFYPVDDLLYHKKHLYGFYQGIQNNLKSIIFLLGGGAPEEQLLAYN